MLAGAVLSTARIAISVEPRGRGASVTTDGPTPEDPARPAPARPAAPPGSAGPGRRADDPVRVSAAAAALIHVAVVGPGDGGDLAAAEDGGPRRSPTRGVVLVCGGLGGVMEAACRGAKEAGGTTIGILPGADRSAANPFVDVAISTGWARRGTRWWCGRPTPLIAVGGGYGTLSEIALALKAGKRVAGIGTWDIDGVISAPHAEAAVETVLRDLST